MASVTLKNIKKIYPNNEPKKKKKGQPEKKSNRLNFRAREVILNVPTDILRESLLKIAISRAFV